MLRRDGINNTKLPLKAKRRERTAKINTEKDYGGRYEPTIVELLEDGRERS